MLDNIERQAGLFFRIVSGRFQPSLRKLVNGVVKQDLAQNAAVRSYRYPRLKRMAMWCARHPLRSLFAVALLYGLIITASRFDSFSSLGFDLAHGVNTGSNAGIGFRDFWNVNVALLGVQAALIGLVFPLVIAFVGLLNQGRAAFASRLSIYVEATAAPFTGISSLLLCVAIAVQLPFAAWLQTSGAAAITGLNLAWFIINVVALAYFILRTISFLHPARRAPIIRAYVANVTWPAELTRIVTYNRWVAAVDYGYLPDGDKVEMFEEGRKARVWYSSLWETGEPRVTRRLGRAKRLVDIRLAMIAPIVTAWLEGARSGEAGETHDFAIPLEPGHDYEGETVLARATLPVGMISRVGIWTALSFRAVSEDPGALKQSARLLHELIAELVALIDTRQADEFSTQMSEVIDFHVFLYQLAQRPDEDFNYAQLGSEWGMFGRALGEEWAAAYRDMIGRAVERLPDKTEFAGSAAYLAANIYSQASRYVSPASLTPLIRLAHHLSFRLMEWASDENRAESAAASRVARTFTLTRLAETYARAWRDFVGGWERLLGAIVTLPDRRDRKNPSWESLKRISPNVVDHLGTTVLMAGRAIWSGDLIATNWTCDLVLHWEGQAERGWDTTGNAYYMLHSEALTLEMLARSWADVAAETLAPDYVEVDASTVVRAIIHNAWFDHMFVLACVSLHWAIHSEPRQTALRAARMLLRSEPHDSGNTGIGDGGAMSSVDILIAALRIVGGTNRYVESSYAGTIEQLTASLGQLGDQERVSLRVYSSDGGLSFHALHTAIALSLLVGAPGPLGINDRLRRLLTQADDEALRRRQDYLGHLIEAFDGITLAQHGDVLTDITGDADPVNFEARQQHARRLVEQARAMIIGRRDEAIIDAQIDPVRLRAVALAAASKAFTPASFPLNLFDEIIPTTDGLSPFTLRITNMDKGAYTDPPMAQAVSNEAEWWSDAMSRQVAAVVWADFLTKAKLQTIDGRTPDEFWVAVRDAAARLREAGYDPVLVIGNASDPPWLLEWRWRARSEDSPRPADLVITRESDQADGYEFSMNDIKVYRAQTAIGKAYLIPTQSLQQLRYHDFGDGVGIEVGFEVEPKDPWRGTMSATFQREIVLKEAQAFAIRFEAESETSESGSEPR